MKDALVSSPAWELWSLNSESPVSCLNCFSDCLDETQTPCWSLKDLSLAADNFQPISFIHFLSALATPARFLFFNSRRSFHFRTLAFAIMFTWNFCPGYSCGMGSLHLSSEILPKGSFPWPRSSSLPEIFISYVLILTTVWNSYTLCLSIAVTLASTFTHSRSVRDSLSTYHIYLYGRNCPISILQLNKVRQRVNHVLKFSSSKCQSQEITLVSRPCFWLQDYSVSSVQGTHKVWVLLSEWKLDSSPRTLVSEPECYAFLESKKVCMYYWWGILKVLKKTETA